MAIRLRIEETLARFFSIPASTCHSTKSFFYVETYARQIWQELCEFGQLNKIFKFGKGRLDFCI